MVGRVIREPAEGPVGSRLAAEVHVIQDMRGPLAASLELVARNRDWHVSLGLPRDPAAGWYHRAQLDHVQAVDGDR